MSWRHHNPRRHSWGIGLLIAAVLSASISIASEFIGVEWWSNVDLKNYRQQFVLLVRGRVFIGTRGTGGFFNRGIPSAGARFIGLDRYGPEPWHARFTMQNHSVNQTRGVSIPVWYVAFACGSLSMLLLRRPRRWPGHCDACGYDTRGLPACPECGARSVEASGNSPSMDPAADGPP